MNTSGLSELEAVLAVARHRSFRAAATELGVSTSALSHAVATLSTIRGAIERAGSFRDTVSGTLRINTSAGAATHAMPLFIAFMQRYPEVKLDIVTEGRLIDIVVEGFDAGIRLAETVPRDMIAVPFGEKLRFAVVASPAYFAQHAQPRSRARPPICTRTAASVCGCRAARSISGSSSGTAKRCVSMQRERLRSTTLV
jgi:DNA-binding transcriptional LysR family regulator